MAESAITAVQATTDGGTRPDNSTEVYIRGVMANLTLIETNLSNLWSIAFVQSGDDAKINPVLARYHLCLDGRRLVTAIAKQLALRPRADIFSSTSPGSSSPDSLSPWTRW